MAAIDIPGFVIVDDKASPWISTTAPGSAGAIGSCLDDASARSLAYTPEKHASLLRPPRVRLCVFVRCVRSHAAGCSRGHRPFGGKTELAPVSRAPANGIRLAWSISGGSTGPIHSPSASYGASQTA